MSEEFLTGFLAGFGKTFNQEAFEKQSEKRSAENLQRARAQAGPGGSVIQTGEDKRGILRFFGAPPVTQYEGKPFDAKGIRNNIVASTGDPVFADTIMEIASQSKNPTQIIATALAGAQNRKAAEEKFEWEKQFKTEQEAYKKQMDQANLGLQQMKEANDILQQKATTEDKIRLAAAQLPTGFRALMDDFFNGKVSLEELNKQEVGSPTRMAKQSMLALLQVRQQLDKRFNVLTGKSEAPATVVTEEDYKKIPVGKDFIFKGQIYTKKAQ